ncbi:hypothetical protein PsorP6_015869 [Peronosclerospora sorghi]|uniref:Uncharacterized protein n=1 Tax=Peronosclerospora sorghi TaxID=230839 RepID=A0ACC0WP30_9STRA|nr:hypothetical protein PsorP6_015869 [Peronosclerospora sorghi]
MARIHDSEVEGVTTFTETPTTSYRYVLKLVRDKLSIWMEDRTSKKQCTDVVELCFTRLALTAMPWSLRISKFKFVLDSVSVKQIDVLESKLRDQQDELERLRGEILTHVELKASTRDFDTYNILWNEVKSVNIAVNCKTGEVSIPYPGVYIISAVVKAQVSEQNDSATLLKNDVRIQKAYFTYEPNNPTTMVLSTTMWLDVNDVLAVYCTCDIQQAFLSSFRLGCF